MDVVDARQHDDQAPELRRVSGVAVRPGDELQDRRPIRKNAIVVPRMSTSRRRSSPAPTTDIPRPSERRRGDDHVIESESTIGMDHPHPGPTPFIAPLSGGDTRGRKPIELTVSDAGQRPPHDPLTRVPPQERCRPRPPTRAHRTPQTRPPPRPPPHRRPPTRRAQPPRRIAADPGAGVGVGPRVADRVNLAGLEPRRQREHVGPQPPLRRRVGRGRQRRQVGGNREGPVEHGVGLDDLVERAELAQVGASSVRFPKTSLRAAGADSSAATTAIATSDRARRRGAPSARTCPPTRRRVVGAQREHEAARDRVAVDRAHDRARKSYDATPSG